MERNPTRMLAMLTLVALATFVGAGRAQGDLPHLLPRNTLLVVEMSDRGAAEMLTQIQAPPFARLISAGPTDVLAALDEGLGARPGTVRAALPHLKAAYFLIEVPLGHPVPAFVFEFDSQESAQALATGLGARAPGAFDLSLGGDKARATVVANCLVVSENAGSLDAMCSKVIGEKPAGTSLADSPDYKAAMAEFKGKSLVWAYGSLVRALEIADTLDPDDETYRQVRNVFGLGGAKWAAAGLIRNKDSLRLSALARFDETMLRAARILPSAEQPAILDRVPADAFGCLALTLNDPAARWQEIKALVRDISAAQNDQQMPARLEQIDAMFGLSLKDSAFAQLKGQMAVFLAEPGATLSRNDWTALLHLKDGPAFETAAVALQSRLMGGQTPEPQTVEGVKVRVLIPNRLFLTVVRDLAIISGSQRALVWYASRLGQRRPQDTIRARTADLYPADSASSIVAAVNVGTLISILPTDMRSSGKFDSWIILDAARTEGQLGLSLIVDSRLGGEALTPDALVSQAGLLAGMVLPAIAKARQQARRTVDISNLRQIGMACMMFAQDNNGFTPSSLADLEKYLGNNRVLVSPMDREPVQIDNTQTRTSYSYLGSLPLKGVAAPSGVIIAFTRKGVMAEGRSCLYLDGHVVWLPEDRTAAEFAKSYEILTKSEMPKTTLDRAKAFYEIK